MSFFHTPKFHKLTRALLNGLIVCSLVFIAPLAASAPQTAFATSSGSTSSIPGVPSAENAQRVVKVGYMDQEGILTRDEEGKYSGYTYDYLIQIAQFTGWAYEFVEATGETEGQRALSLINMLNNGEVDIEGGMTYSEKLAALYEYPKNSYGTTHTSLFASANNTTVSQTNLYTQDVLRVALLSSAKQRREELVAFCEANGITPELVECASIGEAKEKTEAGVADVFLDVDINVHSDFPIAASFNARPYFFGAPLGQHEIIDEIDKTIERINVSNPALQNTLYDKYFNTMASDFALTPDQRAFAQQHEPLRVGVISEKAPLQSFDNKTGEFVGVSKGVLDYLTEKTGLVFEVVKLERTDNIYEAIRANDIDLVAGIDNNLRASSLMGVSLTAPYVSTSMMLVYNRYVNPNDLANKVLAVPWELAGTSPSGFETKVYNSLEECFIAVDSGEADYTYGTSYSTPYYLSLNNLTNLLSLPTSTANNDICFGLVQPVQPELLVILNKSLRAMSAADLDALVYSNSLVDSSERFDQFFREHLFEIALISITILVVIIALLTLYLRTRVKAARSAREETLRFQTLFGLANEQFFEYNIANDTLRISRSQEVEGSLSLTSADGKAQNDTEGTTYRIIQHAHAELNKTEGTDILDALTAPTQVVTEGLSNGANGTRQWIRITSNFVTDDNNRPISVIGKIANIDDEMREKMDLSERAHHDGLTGLLNWKTFQEQATALLSQGKAGAILAIDTDNFKEVNDTFGHLAGDTALQNTAATLRSAFRPRDLVGRLGGDEFAVCINGSITTENLARRCEEIIKNGVVFADSTGKEHIITLSVGGVELFDTVIGFQHAYRQADEALYRAKADGKNRYIVDKAE